MAATKSTRFACAYWQIGDIQSLRPVWSDKQCVEFLLANGRHIEDAMIQAGWTAIEALLPEEEDDA